MVTLVIEWHLIENQVLHFQVDMSSSAHIDDKKKDILVLGKGPT